MRMLMLFIASTLPAFGQGLKNEIPANQPPLLKTIPPATSERSPPGTGKFVIFTREQVGQQWNFIAAAWECIPSQPEKPVTKRVEFCHSSWNADVLMNCLTWDGNRNVHPQFVRLQVDENGKYHKTRLYEIDYSTWAVRPLGMYAELHACGLMGTAIVAQTDTAGVLIDTITGKVTSTPWNPRSYCDDFWLVRPTDEKTGVWSWNPKTQRAISRFADQPNDLYLLTSRLTKDGQNRALLMSKVPRKAGTLAGQLIIQRHEVETDWVIPVEFQAVPGSGIPVLPRGIVLFVDDKGRFDFSAVSVDGKKVRHWRADPKTKTLTEETADNVKAPIAAAKDPDADIPQNVRKFVKDSSYFGPGGLAVAFLRAHGVLDHAVGYHECHAAASPDRKHVLFLMKKGPLAGEFIYGEVQSGKIVRWKVPQGLDSRDAMDFAWVVTK